ncbi:MAG TPA: DUF4231 domain-containing protein [Solirubrobacteraceae bacterium]|jgi:hypothetical protein|nr:DUF4231 domain-containing protein [Solirubrobacteraceae bacterium]
MADESDDPQAPERRRRSSKLAGRLTPSTWDPGPTWKTTEKVLDGELDEAQRSVVKARWLGEAERWQNLWQRQRFIYWYCFRIPIIIGAATVPVLASLSVSKVATALVGLVVAILTGLDSFFTLGTKWQQARLAADATGSEGWRFIELSEDLYKDQTHREAYPKFLTRLERLNGRLARERVDLYSSEGKDSITGRKTSD